MMTRRTRSTADCSHRVSNSNFSKRVVRKLTVISADPHRAVERFRRLPIGHAYHVMPDQHPCLVDTHGDVAPQSVDGVATRELVAEPGHDCAGRPHAGTLASRRCSPGDRAFVSRDSTEQTAYPERGVVAA